ncbi:MAG: hypothetical protein IKS05_06495, partial [Oscillospiraceae bacterium]|nr:hypothetical protein [Oscillospiraceae bacterium]
MKKLLVLSLVLVLSLSLLAGCGEKSPAATQGTTVAATETVVTEPAETRVPAAAKPETIETENVAPTEALTGCSLYVAPVEGLGEDFILGMDASQVP